MNRYNCYFKNNVYEVVADNSYQTQLKCAADNKIKKSYEVTVMLIEKDGTTITHSTTEL